MLDRKYNLVLLKTLNGGVCDQLIGRENIKIGKQWVCFQLAVIGFGQFGNYGHDKLLPSRTGVMQTDGG